MISWVDVSVSDGVVHALIIPEFLIVTPLPLRQSHKGSAGLIKVSFIVVVTLVEVVVYICMYIREGVAL